MATIKSATAQVAIAASAELAGGGVEGERVPIQFRQDMRIFTPTSFPPVSLCYALEIELAGSSSATDTLTLDLADFEDVEGIAQDAHGLRLQMLHVVADGENVDVVTIGPAAADGYDLFGAGNEVEIPPGGEMTFYGHDGLPEVEGDSGSLSTDIDVTGNGGDRVKILMLLG
jgi:hypothetical protein